ncbi:hypothetical protein CPL00229_CDS0102 [Escherichia phage vB_Eco_mar004NP2]|uniref:Uncharacterized protein n=1 Tax=Salmonella phage PMBT29 TaxID=3137286 RepID=A0AAU8BWV0_9VIRU
MLFRALSTTAIFKFNLLLVSKYNFSVSSLTYQYIISKYWDNSKYYL